MASFCCNNVAKFYDTSSIINFILFHLHFLFFFLSVSISDPKFCDTTIFFAVWIWLTSMTQLVHNLFNQVGCFISVSIDDPELGDTTIFYDWKECSSIMPADELTDHNESVVIPESLQHLSTPELREKLQEHGEIPGPITPVTRNVYIKRLARLNSGTTISKVSKLLKLSLLPNPPHPWKLTRISKWIGTFLTPHFLKDCMKLKTSFH